jgi:hypothetical protein
MLPNRPRSPPLSDNQTKAHSLNQWLQSQVSGVLLKLTAVPEILVTCNFFYLFKISHEWIQKILSAINGIRSESAQKLWSTNISVKTWKNAHSNDRIVGRDICIARECVCRRWGSFLYEFDFAQIQEISRDHIWLMESSGFTHVEFWIIIKKVACDKDFRNCCNS